MQALVFVIIQRVCMQHVHHILTPYTVHRTPYIDIVHHTPHTARRTRNIVQRTPYIIHGTPYTLHRTLFFVYRTKVVFHINMRPRNSAHDLADLVSDADR